jgi:hypothetical protein
MRGRLTRKKRIAGFLWAGPALTCRRKENYFRFEHDDVVSVSFGTRSGSPWVRCRGASCEVTACKTS